MSAALRWRDASASQIAANFFALVSSDALLGHSVVAQETNGILTRTAVFTQYDEKRDLGNKHMMVRGTLVVREDIDLMVRRLLQFSTLAVPTRCSAPHSHRISRGVHECVVPSRSIPTTHRRPYGRQVFIPPICTPSRTPFFHTRRHRSLHQLPPASLEPLCCKLPARYTRECPCNIRQCSPTHVSAEQTRPGHQMLSLSTSRAARGQLGGG